MSDSNTSAVPSYQNDEDVVDERDYKALETVLAQTARGRGFLNEYLRRNGVAGQAVETPLPPGSDTDRILGAIRDLHDAVLEQQDQPSVAHVRMDIIEMARAIARTRSEIAAMRTEGNYDQLTAASEEMDAIVQSTEKATTDILQAAEKIQEIAWQLRENGVDDATCDEIDNAATEIYMACSFQDLTGQRTTKVVRVLQYLEARINSMIEIWGLAMHEDLLHPSETPSGHVDERPDSHLLNGPQLEGRGLGQDNIDELIGGATDVAEAMEPLAVDGEADLPETVMHAAETAGMAEAQAAEADLADEEADLDQLLAGFDAAHDEARDAVAQAEAAEVEAELALGDPDDIIDEEQLKALFA